MSQIERAHSVRMPRAGRSIPIRLLVAGALAGAGCGGSISSSADGGAHAKSRDAGMGSSTNAGSSGAKATGGTKSSAGSGGQNAASGSGGSTGAGGGTGGSGTPRHTQPVIGPGSTGVSQITGVKTALPDVGALDNVTGRLSGGSVNLTFDPVDGAKDYRVYELPADSDVVLDSDGTLQGIKNGTFRCAGTRETPKIAMDGDHTFPIVGSLLTLVDNQQVGGYQRPLSEATLGYVYTTPSDSRMPVYALGNPDPSSMLGNSWQSWEAGRDKQYTADDATRQKLVADGWLDYGAVFYVPKTGSGMQGVYSTLADNKARYYYSSDGERGVRKPADSDLAFSVLSAAADGTTPLMRVFYTGDGGTAGSGFGHDELAAGKPYFDRVRQQGYDLPLFEVHWSGMTKETTLVVEALDGACPFQGLLTNKSIAAGGEFTRWFTTDEMRASSPNGELFINGENDAAGAKAPKPLARAFVKITPQPRPMMDWTSHFDTVQETFSNTTPTECTSANYMCDGGTLHMLSSDTFDVTFNGIEAQRWDLFPLLGQIWTSFSDAGADVPGQMRMTPKQTATLSDSTFLHLIMDVNSFTTTRRYPQIVLSDLVDKPLWIATRESPYGHFITFQPFLDWPSLMQLEVCDHAPWAVNMHCPTYDMRMLSTNKLAPNPFIGELTGEDKLNRFELFISTSQAYVFVDGQPYGCAQLDTTKVPPAGPVQVTFGDVLYHSGADNGVLQVLPKSFEGRQKQTVVQRHFDFLGFSSGVDAPEWPSTIPCATKLK